MDSLWSLDSFDESRRRNWAHPESLCLEFGAGRRRLASSAPAPLARARIWTLLLGVPE